MLYGDVSLHPWNLEGQGTILHVSIRLVAATLTQNLTARFESKYIEDWCHVLICHYVFLNRIRMVETRLNEVVHETQQELLSILLLSKSVHGHHFPHVTFQFGKRILVLATKRGIRAEETALLVAPLPVFVDRGTRAIVVKRHSMRKTLQDRVEKAGVAHIWHSIRNSLLNGSHQWIDLSGTTRLFKVAFEISLHFLSFLSFKFELLSSLRRNTARSLRLLIELFEPKEARAVVIRFKHRIVVIAAPVLLPIIMVPIFVPTHLSLKVQFLLFQI